MHGDPGAAHDDETHHAQQEPDESVVAVLPVSTHRPLDPRAKTQTHPEEANQLEAPACRDTLVRKRDRKILDSSANLAFGYPRNSGPPVP